MERMNRLTINDIEAAYINACLEHGANVTINETAVIVTNPATGAQNTKGRMANTQTYDTPIRAAVATCSNLGLGQ